MLAWVTLHGIQCQFGSSFPMHLGIHGCDHHICYNKLYEVQCDSLHLHSFAINYGMHQWIWFLDFLGFWNTIFRNCLYTGWLVVRCLAFSRTSPSMTTSFFSPTSSASFLLWTLLNSGVALVGYYFSAFTVDKRWWGRVRIQVLWVYPIWSRKYHPHKTLLADSRGSWKELGKNCLCIVFSVPTEFHFTVNCVPVLLLEFHYSSVARVPLYCELCDSLVALIWFSHCAEE